MGASDASVRAAVLESGGYPKEWADRADTTPFLRLATRMSGRMLKTSLDA